MNAFTDSPSGYLHPAYADSFAEIATPRELPHSGGWFLERTIPGSDLRDGIGCYPLFACRKWKGLAQDLPALADRLVSLCLITDPFGDFHEEDLSRLVRCRPPVQAALRARSEPIARSAAAGTPQEEY